MVPERIKNASHCKEGKSNPICSVAIKGIQNTPQDRIRATYLWKDEILPESKENASTKIHNPAIDVPIKV